MNRGRAIAAALAVIGCGGSDAGSDAAAPAPDASIASDGPDAAVPRDSAADSGDAAIAPDSAVDSRDAAITPDSAGAPAPDASPTWKAAPALAVTRTGCAPRLEGGRQLLNATSVLTDVVGVGDHWVLAWTDRHGLSTAKVATMSLDGQIGTTRNLGMPGLEPRLAVAGGLIGVVHAAAADPSRRDLPFLVLTPGLEPAGGVRTIDASAGVDLARLSLVGSGDAFGLFAGGRPSQVLALIPEGGSQMLPLGEGTLLIGHTLTGVPGGFAAAMDVGGKTLIRTALRTTGAAPMDVELPQGSTAAALAVDPTTGRMMGAVGGADIRLLDHEGHTTLVSSTVGTSDPRMDVLALGAAGGARTVVVAWTGPALAGVLYHVTGVNSPQMPYFKTDALPNGGTRLWLAAAGDSVGIFVSFPSASQTSGSARYYRILCL